jgi:hypothetical protein
MSEIESSAAPSGTPPPAPALRRRRRERSRAYRNLTTLRSAHFSDDQVASIHVAALTCSKTMG